MRPQEVFAETPMRTPRPPARIALLTLVALAAMAAVGASSATATNTALCKADEDPCSEGNQVTHVHEVTTENATLLSSIWSISCAVLFLSSSAVGALGAPQTLRGNFTYTGCRRNGTENCTITEQNGPATINVLRSGTEEAAVTGEYEVRLRCGLFINCAYNSEGLLATAKGALSGGNGRALLDEQITNKVSGFCPETANLDITTEPLSATYIKG